MVVNSIQPYFNPLWLSDVFITWEILDITASDIDLAPIRCQAITWINDDFLSSGPWGIYIKGILEIQIFSFNKNAFEFVICKMTAILFSPHSVHLWASVVFTMSTMLPIQCLAIFWTIADFLQDCSIFSALAMEYLQGINNGDTGVLL